VAVGGRGQRAPLGAATQKVNVSPGPATRSGSQEALVGLGDLSRRPQLAAENPCAGFFPGSALDNSASVALMVVVKKDGSVKSANVLTESPAGQGFGTAARSCMTRQRFVPALDRAGQPAATAMKVNVRFSR
jgi:TonB family protein